MYLKKTYCYFFIQDYCRYDFFNLGLQQIKEQKLIVRIKNTIFGADKFFNQQLNWL